MANLRLCIASGAWKKWKMVVNLTPQRETVRYYLSPGSLLFRHPGLVLYLLPERISLKPDALPETHAIFAVVIMI